MIIAVSAVVFDGRETMPRQPSQPRIRKLVTRAVHHRWGSVLIIGLLLVTAAEPALTIGSGTESPASPDETIRSRTSQLAPSPGHGLNRAPMIEPPSEPNETQRLVFGHRATATVFLNCTEFWLEMTPTDLDYYLVLMYLDTTTETRYRFMAGPLNGRVADPFGETEFLLLEVQVRVPRAPSVTVHLPRRCSETTTAAWPS